MMSLFRRRRHPSPQGPRKNHWKDPRTGQILTRREESEKGRFVARWGTCARWSGRIIGAALIGWGLVMGVQYSGLFLERLLEITQVTVEGVRQIDKQELIDLVKLKPGTPLHHVVLAGIKERLESHPWVKEATVERVPFHELRISVVERTPTAVVRAGTENYLIDGEGHVLTALSQGDDDSLPLVTGVDHKGLLQGNKDVRCAIMSGIELAKLVGQTYEGRLQVNAADPANLVASIRGVRFHFGEGAIGDQWDRFQQIRPAVRMLDIDGDGDGTNEVDLRYENRVVVRERG